MELNPNEAPQGYLAQLFEGAGRAECALRKLYDLCNEVGCTPIDRKDECQVIFVRHENP
jgi:hypothetical protein